MNCPKCNGKTKSRTVTHHDCWGAYDGTSVHHECTNDECKFKFSYYED